MPGSTHRPRLGIAIAARGLLSAAPASAGDSDAQLWLQTTASLPVAEESELTIEAVTRFGEDDGGLFTVQGGGWLETAIAKGVKLGIGYRHVQSYAGGNATSNEDRARQQISVALGRLGGGRLSGRLRLEQRWRSDGDDMGLRLRPQVKFALPLRAESGAALVLHHESFVELNDTDWGQDAGYRRMRNFIGFELPVAGGISAELGYLNQHDFGRGGPDATAHAASLALSFEL
jgi:hypothetical protein